MTASPSILQPVIICGGSGSRLWPLSREHYPKQLLALAGSRSLLQNTALRVHGMANTAPILVASEKHRFLVAEQFRELQITPAATLLEPIGRNTAPAVAVAALQALALHDDAILLVLPADHIIGDNAAFSAAVDKALPLAAEGALVTFGVKPTHPETGYGYIQRGTPLGEGYEVARFVEKPKFDVAKAYLAQGDYLWNAGIFLFKAKRYLEELGQFEPDMLKACQASFDGSKADLDFVRLDRDAFAESPDNSIDYAVMEKTARAAVVPLDAAWSDVGSFTALWECKPHDANGNVAEGDALLEDSRNCFVHASHRLVSVVGADDLIVVETADAVLVAPRHSAQSVKKVVERLKQLGRDEYATHRKVYRPWGHYEGVDEGQRYQVKRIVVKPGASLSLQMHYHRAEHWIVVSGTAEVTCEDRVYLVAENQSTFIPLGHKHRLRNPGKTQLEMIEVQSGSYLGEDDIVRFEDNYGRA